MKRYAGIKLDTKKGTIKNGRKSYPVAGVTASVESIGEINRRLSLTRTAGGAVLLGPLGALLGGMAKKKQDARQLFLLVEGPDFAWSEEVRFEKGVGSTTANKDKEKKARKFAAAVTTAGKQATARTEQPAAAAAPVQPVPAPSPPVAAPPAPPSLSPPQPAAPTAPAGWYPVGDGWERWYDGTQWTEHTQRSSQGDA
jgi:hypothetical protein